MICMNYDANKMFGLLKFHSGYGNIYFNSPKGYSRKIINAQTAVDKLQYGKKQNNNIRPNGPICHHTWYNM